MHVCLQKKRRGESTLDIDFEVQIFIDKSNQTDLVPERHRFGVGCCLQGQSWLSMLAGPSSSWDVGCVSSHSTFGKWELVIRLVAVSGVPSIVQQGTEGGWWRYFLICLGLFHSRPPGLRSSLKHPLEGYHPPHDSQTHREPGALGCPLCWIACMGHQRGWHFKGLPGSGFPRLSLFPRFHFCCCDKIPGCTAT